MLVDVVVVVVVLPDVVVVTVVSVAVVVVVSTRVSEMVYRWTTQPYLLRLKLGSVCQGWR